MRGAGEASPTAVPGEEVRPLFEIGAGALLYLPTPEAENPRREALERVKSRKDRGLMRRGASQDFLGAVTG